MKPEAVQDKSFKVIGIVVYRALSIWHSISKKKKVFGGVLKINLIVQLTLLELIMFWS